MKYPILLLIIIFFFGCQSKPNQPDNSNNTNTTIHNIVEEKEDQLSTIKLSTPDTAFVTAKSGLRVRNKASLEGERIGVRPYGKKVIITERTGQSMTIQDDGKEITGEWVGIESRLIKKDKVEYVTGYIFDGFLSKKQPDYKGVNVQHFINQRSRIQQGIGGILLDTNLPRPHRSEIATNDTVRLYNSDLKTIYSLASHWFLHHGNRRYIQIDTKDCQYSKERISYSSELGLGNFPRVQSIKNGFAYLGEHCTHPVWIKLEELNPKYVQFKSYAEIFEANPNGGAWEKGYTYTGPNKVLRFQPSLDSKSVLNNIPSEYEIHIIGPIKDNWAKVKIKEAKQVFGEMYYKKSIYGKTWEGWIMITEPDGEPLISPHIFGC